MLPIFVKDFSLLNYRVPQSYGRAITLLLIAVFASRFATNSHALSIAPMSDEQMLAQSDTILVGKVLKKSMRWMTPDQAMIGTDYVIQITDVLLNEGITTEDAVPGTTMTLTFAGGSIGSKTIHIPGVPCLEVGEEGVFCLNRETSKSIVPITGAGKGLYRFLTQPDGNRVVVQGESCSHNGQEPMVQPVRKSFFSKDTNHPAGLTPDAFVDDLKSALIRAKKSPDLQANKQVVIPAGKEHLVFTGDQLPQISVDHSSVNSEGVTTDVLSMPDDIATPEANSSLTPEQHGSLRFTERNLTESSDNKADAQLKYGFNALRPNPPRTFNIPPIYYGNPNWGSAFEGCMSSWNQYAGIFNKLAASQNGFGANGRNDFAFTNSTTLSTKYGFGFEGALAACVYYTVSNRIVESDVLVNQEYTWTLDFNTAYFSENIFLFKSTVLHELGHAFGLNHQFESDPFAEYNSTMNYFTSGNFDAESGRIFRDDAAAIRFAYPGLATSINDLGIYLFFTYGDGNSSDANEVYWSDFPGSVEAGGILPLSDMVLENAGTSALVPNVRFYLVTSPLTFNGQIDCGLGTYPSMPTGTSAFASAQIPIPLSTPPGTYYLAAYLTDSDGNNTNRTTWANVPITVFPASPDNDDFVDAFPLEGVSGDVEWFNNGATLETGEPVYHAGKSVWWYWTSPASGLVRFSTLGSTFDTLLGAYTGNSVNALTIVRQNDDTGGSSHSTVQFTAVQGVTYRIAVDGYAGTTGDITLSWFMSVPFAEEFSDTDLSTWLPSGQNSGPENGFDPTSPDDVDIAKSIGLLQTVVTPSPANGGRQKIAGWYHDNVLSADDVGPDKWVRGKFYIYTNRPFTDNLNTVSNFRVRLQNEGAVLGGMNFEYAQTGHGASYEPIYALFNSSTIETEAGQYFRPSATSSKPSLYRADLDPIDVPALTGTRVWATFESFSFVAPSDCILTLTEFVAGTYAARQPAFGTKIFEYDRTTGTAGGAGGTKTITFAGFNHEANLEAGRRQDLKFPGLDAADPYSPALVPAGFHTVGATGGIRMSTANTPSNLFGIGIVQLLSEQASPADNPRIQLDKLYHARYYVTSPLPTTSTNSNATITGALQLRAQTAALTATAYMYINGPANATSPNDATKRILTESAPGIGTQNPDYNVGDLYTEGEDGGWYSVVMSSPWSTDIRQDGNTFGTFADEPGPGINAESMKDITFGADLIKLPRTAKFGPAPYHNIAIAQPNNVDIRISRVEVYEHDAIDDGGYGY